MTTLVRGPQEIYLLLRMLPETYLQLCSPQ